MTAERTLTRAELNRALLARQLLLRRVGLRVPAAIERIGALQAQWPPAPYVALWSRLENFSRPQLSRAVERRRVVKATLMRATLHLVSSRDYLSYAGAFRTARVAAQQARAKRIGASVEDVARLAPRIVALATEQPRSRPELLELLDLPRLRIDDLRPWVVWHLLVCEAELVHSPESSAWRRHTAGGKFAPAPAWLGESAAAELEPLVRRYLAAFGPATRADIAQWTGLPVGTLDPALQRIPLRRFRDEHGLVLLDVPRAALPPADTAAPVRLLPWWDSSLLAHQDRSRILPDEYRKTVIKAGGDVQPTFLVDGFVAGVWSLDGDRIELEPFEPLSRRARTEVEREARALESWL